MWILIGREGVFLVKAEGVEDRPPPRPRPLCCGEASRSEKACSLLRLRAYGLPLSPPPLLHPHRRDQVVGSPDAHTRSLPYFASAGAGAGSLQRTKKA